MQFRLVPCHAPWDQLPEWTDAETERRTLCRCRFGILAWSSPPPVMSTSWPSASTSPSSAVTRSFGGALSCRDRQAAGSRQLPHLKRRGRRLWLAGSMHGLGTDIVVVCSLPVHHDTTVQFSVFHAARMHGTSGRDLLSCSSRCHLLLGGLRHAGHRHGRARLELPQRRVCKPSLRASGRQKDVSAFRATSGWRASARSRAGRRG